MERFDGITSTGLPAAHLREAVPRESKEDRRAKAYSTLGTNALAARRRVGDSVVARNPSCSKVKITIATCDGTDAKVDTATVWW